MKSSSPLVWMTLVPVAGALLAGLAGCSQGRHQPVHTVRQVLDQQVADWNAGDLEGFLRGYWASPELTFSAGGATTRGYDAVAARYRERYGGGAAMGELAFSELEIEPLGDAAAMVSGRWHLKRADKGDVGGVFTLVMRRVGGTWVIVHDHTSQME